jgi:uncharacterized Zn-finger protein
MKQQQEQSRKTCCGCCCCHFNNNKTPSLSHSVGNGTNSGIIIKDETSEDEFEVNSTSLSFLLPSPTFVYPLPLPIHLPKPINIKRSLVNASKIVKAKERKLSANHQGEKRVLYICPHPKCDRVYNKFSHLRYHERKHSGEKPFPCTWPECEWKFARSDELTRHRR